MNSFFKGFKKGVMSFSYNVSLVVNSVLLLLVYIVGVGLTLIFAKIAGKHFLDRKIEKKAKTYWSDLNLKKKPLEEYYRQF